MMNGVGAVNPAMRLESVSRDGYEKNREKFQELFRKSFPREFRQAILDQQSTKKDLTFRLITEGENPIGLVVYATKPSTAYKKIFGYECAFVVGALHVEPKFNRAVRQVLIQTACEMNADSIIVKVSKSDLPLKIELVNLRFRKIECLMSDLWEIFVYDQKNEPSQQQDESETTSGKRDRDEDEPPKDVKGKGEPSVKEPKVEAESHTIIE